MLEIGVTGGLPIWWWLDVEIVRLVWRWWLDCRVGVESPLAVCVNSVKVVLLELRGWWFWVSTVGRWWC